MSHTPKIDLKTKTVSILKSILRVIVILFFSIIILIGLFSFSTLNFFSIVISSIAIFIALPYFNKFTSSKFNYRVPTWIKAIALIVMFFVAISLIDNSEKDSKIPSSANEPEKLNLGEMTAEQVLDKYTSYFNYKGISDRLNKISFEKQLASSVILEMLETDESYLSKRKSLNSDWLNTCSQATNIFKQDVCGNMTQNLNRWNSIERKFEILSKEVIEETGDIVKIKVKHKTIFDNTFQVNETLGETIYILKTLVQYQPKQFYQQKEVYQKKRNITTS